MTTVALRTALIWNDEVMDDVVSHKPTKITVGDYLRSWLDGKSDITDVTRERYTEIIENRIVPAVGAVELQKLKPKHVQDWLSDLSRSGGLRYGQGLSARTVRHCYRVLWGALKQAVKLELLSRTDQGRQGRAERSQAWADREPRSRQRMPARRTPGASMG